ncbi:GNAT family N-acetyltransferase [Nonomuraea sp. NPDC050663]|uniref:GNAT family N-acetyltransferase n=1 Tax=Nonomuraea sp. NPDC050663 TaxID=3364370 RepID=UPI0037A220E1
MDADKQHAERVRRADPLVAVTDQLPALGQGEQLVEVKGAVGVGAVSRTDPGSLNATWGPLVKYTLQPRVATAAAFGDLLDKWQAGIGARGDDHALSVTWPSRDTSTVLALARRGFAPTSVVAVRTAGRTPGRPTPLADGYDVRRAVPSDLERMSVLYEQLVAYEAQFGWLRLRPSTARGLRGHLGELLNAPESWCWVAERDGHVAGMMTVEPPSAAGWIASLTTASPVAYLGLAFLDPALRGVGVADAMAARVGAHLDASGVAATLLHYQVANPMSGPFWARQGYRPLLTTWGRHLAAG